MYIFLKSNKIINCNTTSNNNNNDDNNNNKREKLC